ncbi:MAG: TonB family protein [Pyrinomonadaceae bacterium]
MICTSCGNAVESFNKFCPKCGAPVQPSAPPQYGSAPPYSAPQMPMGGPTAPPAKKSSCGKIILIGGIILLLLVGGLAVAAYFGYHKLEQTLKSSEAYTVALNALKTNEEVREQLGDIVDTGFPLGAFSQKADGSGNAAFVMSVQGTKESGQYEVNLLRNNSVWSLAKGVLRTNSGQIINVADQSSDNEDANLNSNTDTGVNTDETVTPGKTVSGGVLNGKAINLPKPAYPPIAKQAKASGTVVVQVLVDEKGNVVTARAVSGHPLLQAASVAAARGAKFSPTKLNGKPVKVSGVLRFEFTAE